MRARGVIVAVASSLAIIVLSALPASAQRRTGDRGAGPVPAAGMVGVGVSTGVAVPSERFLENGVAVSANAEGYLSRRVSVRGQLSGAWADIFGHSFTGTVSPMVVDGNLVYNWEGGAWHPYVTGGAGLYHYRFNEADRFSTANKLGVDFGGGFEYFLTRRDTVTGEGLVHVVNGPIASRLTVYESNYWTLAIGYKKYFGR